MAFIIADAGNVTQGQGAPDHQASTMGALHVRAFCQLFQGFTARAVCIGQSLPLHTGGRGGRRSGCGLDESAMPHCMHNCSHCPRNAHTPAFTSGHPDIPSVARYQPKLRRCWA